MKNKTFLTLSLFIIGSLLLSACQLPFVDVVRGSGELVTETRDVGNFEGIKLDGVGRLVITQGSSVSLEITAEDNIMEELTSEVQGTTLVLGYQDQTWLRTIVPTKVVVYTLTVTDLSEVIFNGAGELEMSGLDTDSFYIEINGAARVDIDELITEDLVVEIDGTGTVTIAGKTSSQEITIQGAGNYQASDLQSDSTAITIAGLGNGTVWATENLDITIDGGGTVNYFGSPNVTQDINGLGEIKNQGEK
jgi:hypothetical protein